MLRTASIKLRINSQQSQAFSELRAAYADACNLLVPEVIANRRWNRVALHHKAYYRLRAETRLGSQMVCNVIFTLSKAYQSQKELGKIKKDLPIPAVSFARTSVHFERTYSMRGEYVSLYTLAGRQKLPMIMGKHQQGLLQAGRAKEAELICRRGAWFLNIVVESDDPAPRSGAVVLGVDVGENNLAATSTGKVWGGGELRHQRDRRVSLRRRLQCNGSESAKQLLSKVSGKERRHVRHVNHEVSRAIVREAERVRSRLHRWTFRELQAFVAYKAAALGIAVAYVNPAWTSQTCSDCGALGVRRRHCFSCSCGLRAHSDVNAARNHARMGGAIALSRAAVNQPDVAEIPF